MYCRTAVCRIIFFPFWIGVENRLYDFFLGLKSAVKEDSLIVLLDIDDVSIEKSAYIRGRAIRLQKAWKR